jgi:proteasome accessory factor B
VSVARAERLVNLVLCLLSTRQYLTAERVRRIVPGYSDAPTDEAFFRTFERDKTELRELGIPLEIGRNSAFDTIDGYRIARRDYELGDIDLEPDEAAAVALAVRLWDSPELVGAAHGALLKLRAAGVDVDEGAPAVVEPKVRTTEPAFGPLLAAVQAGQAVTFDYRRPSPAELRTRTIEPWGVVSWRGRWYVVGHDRDRNAPRCFRLSRIVGEVGTIGRPGVVRRPEGVDLLTFVAHTGDEAPPQNTIVRLWLAHGRAAGLRRRATVVDTRTIDDALGEIVELELYNPDSAAGWIAGFGPDVVVLEPEILRKAVHERLLAAAGR